ncbi:hypothetical protein SAMN06893096_10783 [Geodermatophilus pulveris]|uniref:Serine aminopeptidase, S33 n=1 Tax=Geodermatophilus pulveris TaxID=1564159 RepID=A0A239GXJ1_9ACTN|nr:hypothetical protein [Geodermatophilus pulveris]SNS73233.1 hypothetical protein SAMN06893096_10783 [Geodermatophilus pulveris]
MTRRRPRRGAGRAAAALAVAALLGGCSAPAVPAAGPAAAPVPPADRVPPAESVSPATVAEPLPDLGPGVHEVEVGGQAAVVVRPQQPNGRLVLYAHGLDARGTAVLAGEGFGALADGLVAAGYAVAASDAGGDAWGDAASVDAHAALAAAVTDLVDATDVYLVAESMGGLAGARLVEGRRIPGLRAYAGIQPLCDLGSVYDDHAASIDTAYGPAVDGALRALSPVRLDAAVPAVFWASAEDTVVDRARNADVCAAQVVADGGSAVVRAAEGEHGDPSHYDLGALLDLFASTAAPPLGAPPAPGS